MHLRALGDREAKTELLGRDASLALLESETRLTDALTLDGLALLLGERGVGADGVMRLLVDLLEVVRVDALLLVAAELTVVRLGVLLEQVTHVVRDVAAEDVLAQDLAVELLLLVVVADQTALAVRNVKATVKRALHRSEHTAAGRGAVQTDIEQRLERTALVQLLDRVEARTSRLLHTGVQLVHADLLEQTASNKQASRVRCLTERKQKREAKKNMMKEKSDCNCNSLERERAKGNVSRPKPRSHDAIDRLPAPFSRFWVFLFGE